MTSPTPAEYQDAYELLTKTLADWGITDLNDTVRQILEEGWAPEVAELRLRDTPSYKQRFSANQQRIAKGASGAQPGRIHRHRASLYFDCPGIRSARRLLRSGR